MLFNERTVVYCTMLNKQTNIMRELIFQVSEITTTHEAFMVARNMMDALNEGVISNIQFLNLVEQMDFRCQMDGINLRLK